MIKNSREIKSRFRSRIESLKEKEPFLKDLFNQLNAHGSAYVVGGFLRDTLTDESSRDLDIIVDLKEMSLQKLVDNMCIKYTTNRLNGIKIKLKSISVDLWEMDNNWAFKYNVVKRSSINILESIARGCFYNFDSLVINLFTYQYNIRYYRRFRDTNTLDIILKHNSYKSCNLTPIANIIRAFYIREKFNTISFSDNLADYINVNTAGFDEDNMKLKANYLRVKRRYPKYDEMSDNIFINSLSSYVHKRKNLKSHL